MDDDQTTSKLGTKCGWTHEIFEQIALIKNLTTNKLVHSKLYQNMDPWHTNYDSKTYKVYPIFPAIKLTKAQDDEWERPIPQVTLKIWDPTTGEFIRTTE